METYKLTDKMFSRYKKLSLSYILKLFLNFEPQYSCKVYSHKNLSKFLTKWTWLISGLLITNYKHKGFLI